MAALSPLQNTMPRSRDVRSRVAVGPEPEAKPSAASLLEPAAFAAAALVGARLLNLVAHAL